MGLILLGIGFLFMIGAVVQMNEDPTVKYVQNQVPLKSLISNYVC
jgi:dipeptide/tripeptide permease